MTLTPNMTGVILAATGFMLYAIGDVGFKYAGQSINVFQIAFYAQIFGIMLLLLYALLTGKTLKTKKIKLHAIRAICIIIPYFVALYAFQHKSLAESYVFFYMAPFFTGLFAHYILKERFTKHQFAAVTAGFIGVLIILRPGLINIDWIGLAIIFSSICYAYATVITRRYGEGESELVLSLYTTIAIFLASIIPFMMHPITLPLEIVPAVLVAGTFEATATGLVSLACVKARAVTVQKLGYTGLVWAFIFGWFFFQDFLFDFWTGVGAIIIISSGIYMIYRENLYSHKDD